MNRVRITGMVHLAPLLGYEKHPGMDVVIARAVADARALERGGVDSIMLENTDDDPHTSTADAAIIASYALVARAVADAVRVPLGITVLWNDAPAALAIASLCGGVAVRIPVYTQAIVTSCGIIVANPRAVHEFRRQIGGQRIAILADVHVKHAAQLAPRPLVWSARDTLEAGADELILTGNATGDEPAVLDVESVRAACPQARIALGSGVTAANIARYAPFVNHVIVGTAIKTNGVIDEAKVRSLVAARDACTRTEFAKRSGLF